MTYTLSNKLQDTARDLPCSILKLAMDDKLTIMSANDMFCKLTGYDMTDELPKSLFKMVYSADAIYFTQQAAQQKLRNDNQLIFFFRVLQKNGILKWIMINGNKTEENINLEGKSFPVYFCMAADVTLHMNEYKQMEKEIEYHRIILDLSRELFFDYMIATDTLYFSGLFRDIFGKNPVTENFSMKLMDTKVVHPDDLPVVINIFKGVMNGKKQTKFEIRLMTKEGKTVWYVCYATIIYDENKNPYKVVGKLVLINKSENNEMPDTRMLSDVLTGLYYKDAVRHMVSRSMFLQKPGSLSALLLCKVQNYKGKNEMASLKDNDNVIAMIASILRSLLRKTDIIGRTGEEEFVIYMKDIGSKKAAYNAAEQICREVDSLYSYKFYKNRVYISIGITFAPARSDYAEVLSNAETALALAEDNKESSFEVYWPAETYNI